MSIKKSYRKPRIEEHEIDLVINLFNDSTPPTPPTGGASMAPPSLKSAGPQYQSPSSPDYPFGGDSPDYSNL